MQKLDLKEIRRRQLNILKSVHECCEKNNLRYYLCGGTLLGAVRHKGYIPWDDDIDICLPRPDYERFLVLYTSDQYEILTWKPNNEYIGLYAKISDTETLLLENGDFGEKSGIYIDVFPVDGLPSSDKSIKAHIRWMKFLQGLIVSTAMGDISHRPLHRRIEIRLIRLFLVFAKDKHKMAHFIIEQAKRYDFDKSEKVGVVVWGYGAKEVIDKKVATEYIPGDFEGYHFMILKDYDAYLSSLYGDYMKLPPEEKRVSKHNPEVYLLEKKERQHG